MKALTARQSEVLRLCGEGLQGKQIAHQLAITEQAVAKHRAAIKRKLKLPSNAALVRHGALEHRA